jgi:hypothetical protein
MCSKNVVSLNVAGILMQSIYSEMTGSSYQKGIFCILTLIGPEFVVFMEERNSTLQLNSYTLLFSFVEKISTVC